MIMKFLIYTKCKGISGMEKQRVPYKMFFLLKKVYCIDFWNISKKKISAKKKDPFDFKLRILFRHGSLNSNMGPLYCCFFLFLFLFLLRLAKLNCIQSNLTDCPVASHFRCMVFHILNNNKNLVFIFYYYYG